MLRNKEFILTTEEQIPAG